MFGVGFGLGLFFYIKVLGILLISYFDLWVFFFGDIKWW